MNITVRVSPNKVKGYNDLKQLDGRCFDGVSSRVIHFVYNLHSVSFIIVMIPTTRQKWWGENACILKIRCEGASVHYQEFGYCVPAVFELSINEYGDTINVALGGYADIRCRGIAAKVEQISLSSLQIPWLGNLV